jgi:hypothetical protein
MTPPELRLCIEIHIQGSGRCKPAEGPERAAGDCGAAESFKTQFPLTQAGRSEE